MPLTLRIYGLTALAMLAFAANSVLARLALEKAGLPDSLSFTFIRLLSAAVMLTVLLRLRSASRRSYSFQGVSVLSLLGYAAAFSIAYLRLETGMGALILFGAVQITMIGWGIKSGERLTPWQFMGLLMALGAFIYLMSPGIGAPDRIGAIFMGLSGICWGIYSLAGRRSDDPLLQTANNFLWTLPFAAVFGVIWFAVTGIAPSIGKDLILYAVLSGAVTSGIGYAIWYKALSGLTATEGGIVQLSVPVIAALGGVVLVSEPLTSRLALSALLILGGIALTLKKKAPTEN